MLSRTRNMSRIVSGGTITNHVGGPTLATYAYAETRKVTEDFYLKERRDNGLGLPPSNFSSDTFDVITHNLSSVADETFYFRNCASGEANYEPGFSPPLSGRGTTNRRLENEFYVQQLLASTNPFRSEFSVPVFIKELVELMTFFKIAARTFAELVGSSYLAYRFGWTQFVRDIRKLATITVALERRIKEIQSLGKNGGLRRRIPLDSKGFSPGGANVSIWSVYGKSVKADRSSDRHLTVWGSVRWMPVDNGLFKDLDKLSQFNLAVLTIFDLKVLNVELPNWDTVWNSIPFSWLVDYFTNLGEYLTSKNGRGLVEPQDICIMRKTICVDTYRVTSHTVGLLVTGRGKHTRTIRQRDVCLPGKFPAIPIDLLTANQWKIVLALFLKMAGKPR